MLGAGVVHAS